jgi:hypothetical protein
MSNEFIVLPKHVKDMTSEELKEYFPDHCSNAYLMRSLIMNEKQFYKPSRDARTLRGVWYSTIKPTLDKLNLLTDEDQTHAGLTKWDAALSKYMADLLRKGYLLYEDLGIIDVSRRRETPSNIYNVTDIKTYGFKISIAPYSNIIIATEKDTVYSIINKMAKLLGCSCISCKGQNALGAMESLIKSIVTEYNKVDCIHILTLTDYDPAGYYIANALSNQAKDILHSLGEDHININYKRIGIVPNQLSPALVEANKYTPKPANIEKWMQITGGINGEPKGLELDALTPDMIRKIFIQEIQPYINEEKYKEFVKHSYIRKIVLDEMSDKINKLIYYVESYIDEDITVEDFSIFDYAQQGFDSLPTQMMCDFDESFKLESIITKFFKEEK